MAGEEMQKIGIVGFGFVGRAIVHGFRDRVKFYINDPKLKDSVSIEEIVQECELIFIGVPTPMNTKTGEIDASIMNRVITDIYGTQIQLGKRPIVIIKSTITPDALRRYKDDNTGLRLVMNPEFLTEKHAYLDFLNQTRIVLGGDPEDTEIVGDFYQQNGFSHVQQWHMSLEAAALVKYMGNTFLALKLSFMNEWYRLAQETGQEPEWESIVAAFLGDGRIGNSHVNVPGPDGRLGWGGKCLVGSEMVFVQDKKTSWIVAMSIEELCDHYMTNDIKQYLKIASYDLMHKNSKITFEPIIGVSQREVETTIKVQTTKGYRWETTVDHKFNVYRDDRFIKVEASELQIGDWLPIALKNTKIETNEQEVVLDVSCFFTNEPPRFVELEQALSKEQIDQVYHQKLITYDQKRRLRSGALMVPYRIAEYLSSKIAKFGDSTHQEYLQPVQWRVDKSFAKLVGYYLAEGCITNNQTYFSFNVSEVEYIEEVQFLLDQFGFGWSERIQDWNNKPSCHVIRVHGKTLAYLLKTCLQSGTNCYDKRMPSLLFSNNDLAWSCLEGFFKGDGSVYGAGQSSKYVTLNMASASKILIEQIAWLLRNYGIIPSYTEKGRSYQLDISSKKEIERFLTRIELLPKEQKHIAQRLEKIKKIANPKYRAYSTNVKLVQVTSITHCTDTQQVYSLEVEKTERFVTSNGLVISNCFPKDLNAIIKYAEQRHGLEMRTLKAAWQTNLKVRQEKDWEGIEGATSNG